MGHGPVWTNAHYFSWSLEVRSLARERSASLLSQIYCIQVFMLESFFTKTVQRAEDKDRAESADKHRQSVAVWNLELQFSNSEC